MSRRRRPSAAAVLGAFAAGLGLLPLRAAGWLPAMGIPLVAFGVRALAALLAACALWQLRPLLGAAASAFLRRAEDTEDRLFGQLAPRTARWARALSVALSVALGTSLAIENTPIEQGLESRFVDRWFSMRFPQRSLAELATQASEVRHRDDIVIVAIDDETVERLGWPLPRAVYAQLIDTVSAAGAASLGFDVALLDASALHPESDQAIGEAAARAGKVFFTYVIAAPGRGIPRPLSAAAQAVLAANTIPIGAPDPARRDLPEFAQLGARYLVPKMVLDPVAQGSKGVAMANVVTDGDDVLRHSVLVARLGEQLHPSLSLRLAAFALDMPLQDIRIYPGSHLDLGGKRRVPIDALGRTLVRYQGRSTETGARPFRYVSLGSLLRFEAALTLVGSPLGEEQEFLLSDSTPLAAGGQSEGGLLLSRLQPGSLVSGLADYTSEPGRILELLPGASAVPSFEVLDESRLRFTTRVGRLRRLGKSPASLAGKHVLLGSTALAASDLYNTPLGAIPGVEHHATMLSNLLHGDFFETAPLWTRLLLTLLAALLAALAGSLASPGAGWLLAALLLCSLVVSTFVAFAAGVHMPFVAPAAALTLAYGLCVLLGFRAERRARARAEAGREFVRRTFGRYLTDQVVQEILDSPDGLRFGGQRRFVTLMMTDLRGFTSMCGAMEPENVVTLLNHYLEAMTRIIVQHGGIIDEFIGDAILVVFGAPLKRDDDEVRAVVCALQMQNAMAEINRWNQERGLPTVEMGIGLHSGEVVLGNIGSELRAKYGIVGSTINLTSRVESCTVGGQVLAAEATLKRCQPPLRLGSSQTLSPKGVRGTLTVYEILGVGAPYEVELARTAEELLPPATPLRVRYALVTDKQVGETLTEAAVEALSARGLELRCEPPLAALVNLRLQLLDANGAPLPGELYGKVLHAGVRPGVVYVRLTSVPPELRRVLAVARDPQDAASQSVLDAPIVAS